MAGPTLLFSTILVSFLSAQSCLCYRSLRDNNYCQTSIDDARRYIDGFLNSARYRGQSITTNTNHHETTLSYVHDQQQHGTFNVLDYGAVGDGKTDSANAFLKAWEDFCGATREPTLVIPYGKVFLITPVSFQVLAIPRSFKFSCKAQSLHRAASTLGEITRMPTGFRSCTLTA
ncbi:Probable polygalacturonase At3g15720 [Linum perenne]